jgi:hypothetical protein
MNRQGMILRTILVKIAHQRKYIVLMGCLSIYLYFQYGNASPPRHCTSFGLHEYPPSGTPRSFPQVKKRERREEFRMEFPLDNVLDIVESIQATGKKTANPINNTLDYYNTIYNINCSDEVELVIICRKFSAESSH